MASSDADRFSAAGERLAALADSHQLRQDAGGYMLVDDKGARVRGFKTIAEIEHWLTTRETMAENEQRSEPPD